MKHPVDFSKKTLSELLILFAHGVSTRRTDDAEEIKKHIVSTYEKKQQLRYTEALARVDEMTLSEKVKQSVKDAKVTAIDVINHINPDDITSMQLLEKIIEETIKKNKGMITVLKKENTI